MTDSRKVVKVFLASPGDLSDERKAAKAVVDEINNLIAEEFGYQVEIVGWEDTVSVFGRPQSIINRDLESCELFVGLMWKKWGTPPDTIGTFTSGFEEEFESSVSRRRKEGRPEISLLFKEIDPELIHDPGEDLKKVLAFKNKLIEQKIILFENFFDTYEFEKKLRRCIFKYVHELRKREAEEVSTLNQATKPVGEKQLTAEESNLVSETPLSIEGTKFLRNFISTTERDADKDQIAAVDVARFRLLASIVGSGGNDKSCLGAHDANLIFAEGHHYNFGKSELTGLLESGFEHYVDENVPFWRWFAATDGFTSEVLPVYSFIGSSTERKVGALAAMRLISEPLPSDLHLSREYFLKLWFAKDMASDVKIAALSYLGDCGITADLDAINEELNRADYQTTSAAVDAIIRINLRDSRDKAINSLFELQPASISRKVLLDIFENEAAISTDILIKGIGHRNTNVRLIVVEILCNRRALPKETAEQLLEDNDARIRYWAVKSLNENGSRFSDEEAENIIVKKVQQAGLGILGMGISDSGEKWWSHFQSERLRLLSDKELEADAIKNMVFGRDAKFILEERRFKTLGEYLRKCIGNQFKEEFDQELSKMKERLRLNDALIEKIRKLENSLRMEFTRKGLDIICRKANSCDLTLVRMALKSGLIKYSKGDVEYLRKFGEWEDIQLIINFVGGVEREYNSIHWLTPQDSKYRIASRAIYELGRTRLTEVLSMTMPSLLLSQLIVEIPDKIFRNFTDAMIEQLLRSEEDVVRKSASLKCIRSLRKGRIKDLLANYITDGQFRYYNVIHWLDFGASTPRERSLPAVEKILNKE